MSRLFLLLLILFLPAQAFALAGDWVKDDAVAVRLISGIDATGDVDTVPLGIDIQLAEGWHTYWRSPGEAGLPPQLDWTRSQTDAGNLQSATFHYPAPRRYTAYNLETIGYRDHVLFPIDAVLRKKGQSLNADLSLDILACSTICVPKHFDVKLAVPAGAATESAEAALLRQAHDQLPADPDSAGLLLQSIANDGHTLTFTVTSHDALTQPDIFIEDDANIGFSAPQVAIDPQGHTAEMTVTPVDTLPAGTTLGKLPLTLTIVNGDHATEIKTTTPDVTAIPTVAPPQIHLRVALLFALIGGLILNLMPCVLPVLSLKILGVVSHGGGVKRKVQQSFLTTAAGILFSFLIMAFVTVILKNSGMALGWGVQFQQPVFLMFLVFLLTFFAANLWGLFEIPLPSFLVDRLDKFYHPKLAGDFATGAFATLLATPCSAPFLGTAVGFALASGVGDIFAVFLTLGLGMSLPYLTVALFPRAATLLPKPGAWMLKLRHFLGFALGITALWLTWVLAAQITVEYAAVFGLFMTAIVILLILKKRGIKQTLIVFGIVEVCIVALVVGMSGAFKPKAAAEMNRQWLPYDQNAVDADIAEGKTVFLDVTADWCLTCKANMRFVLSNDEITHRLFHSGIVAVQADWTNPDPAITDLLHKYGRYGIPFNIVYGPRAPQGIVLPELLTKERVLKALDAAGGGS